MGLFGWFRRERDAQELRATDRERLRDLEGTVKSLQVEWSSTFESLDRLARKLSKREQRALQEENGDSAAANQSFPQSKDELRRWALANGKL